MISSAKPGDGVTASIGRSRISLTLNPGYDACGSMDHGFAAACGALPLDGAGCALAVVEGGAAWAWGAFSLGSAAGGAVGGAIGVAWPNETETPNKRHCRSTGAKAISKLTWVGTDGKKPAMCIMPFASICGSRVSCGSSTT